MDARIQALPFDPAALHGPVASAADQPPSEQLRRRGQAAERDPRRSSPRLRFAQRAGLRAQRPQARGADRHQFDAAARAVLRAASAATARPMAPAMRAGAGRQLRQRRALARGVRRHGQGAGRRLGLGAAGVPAARRHAGQPVGRRPHARRWPAACRSWRSTCTSTPTTWTTARRRGAYVDAFMDNIDWAAVYQRYQQAVHARQRAVRRRRRTRSTARCCSTCAAPACSSRRDR